jgi:hypothetical protein
MAAKLKGIAFFAGLLLLLVVPFLNSTVGAVWRIVLAAAGAYAVAGFLLRWARRRDAAGPGLRGFVPRKTPSAP